MMKIKFFAIATLALFLSVQASLADLKVGQNGKVGIGTEPTIDCALNVLSDGDYAGQFEANASGYGSRIGVRGSGMNGTTNNLGITGIAVGGLSSYGVSCAAVGASERNYAVAGEAYGTNSIGFWGYGDNYAGYFVGNLHYTGILTQGSDGKLKENIQPIGNVLAKLMMIKPKSFNYKENDPQYKPMNLAKGMQYGLIAQELEVIFPELVFEEVFVRPDRSDHALLPDPMGESKAAEVAPVKINYKSINYIELIPILVQAIQEQQNEIEELRAQITQTGKP